MFENVGSKVSAIAIIYFVISLLAAIGGGILVWISVDHLGFLFFLLIVVGGFLSRGSARSFCMRSERLPKMPKQTRS